jgi:putative toxin-antitoxin system antitoxin component (TIGR02293 family)
LDEGRQGNIYAALSDLTTETCTRLPREATIRISRPVETSARSSFQDRGDPGSRHTGSLRDPGVRDSLTFCYFFQSSRKEMLNLPFLGAGSRLAPFGRQDADRGRIESMAKVRKGARSRRPARIVAANHKARLVPKEVIDAAALRLRQESEPAALKANPEELTKVVARATEVFGDQDVAFRWLGTPVGALDYATPISCLSTHRGAVRVNDVLTQIEHGVW